MKSDTFDLGLVVGAGVICGSAIWVVWLVWPSALVVYKAVLAAVVWAAGMSLLLAVALVCKLLRLRDMRIWMVGAAFIIALGLALGGLMVSTWRPKIGLLPALPHFAAGDSRMTCFVPVLERKAVIKGSLVSKLAFEKG